ncbi:uncharacterized protein EMH_0024140 [Eimeria mitis]|uniref:Uncharacterized protein n=1 Tax=Eimeria mitis TaxID=44415 RepID=U6K033_9EIME|nr:uncharacterized protein EMH_0024140 [Eimeria mitis]CDJ29677.1 hypothetical protein, conserved [Eimeria mitis]
MQPYRHAGFPGSPAREAAAWKGPNQGTKFNRFRDMPPPSPAPEPPFLSPAGMYADAAPPAHWSPMSCRGLPPAPPGPPGPPHRGPHAGWGPPSDGANAPSGPPTSFMQPEVHPESPGDWRDGAAPRGPRGPPFQCGPPCPPQRSWDGPQDHSGARRNHRTSGSRAVGPQKGRGAPPARPAGPPPPLARGGSPWQPMKDNPLSGESPGPSQSSGDMLWPPPPLAYDSAQQKRGAAPAGKDAGGLGAPDPVGGRRSSFGIPPPALPAAEPHFGRLVHDGGPRETRQGGSSSGVPPGPRARRLRGGGFVQECEDSSSSNNNSRNNSGGCNVPLAPPPPPPGTELEKGDEFSGPNAHFLGAHDNGVPRGPPGALPSMGRTLWGIRGSAEAAAAEAAAAAVSRCIASGQIPQKLLSFPSPPPPSEQGPSCVMGPLEGPPLLLQRPPFGPPEGSSGPATDARDSGPLSGPRGGAQGGPPGRLLHSADLSGGIAAAELGSSDSRGPPGPPAGPLGPPGNLNGLPLADSVFNASRHTSDVRFTPLNMQQQQQQQRQSLQQQVQPQRQPPPPQQPQQFPSPAADGEGPLNSVLSNEAAMQLLLLVAPKLQQQQQQQSLPPGVNIPAVGSIIPAASPQQQQQQRAVSEALLQGLAMGAQLQLQQQQAPGAGPQNPVATLGGPQQQLALLESLRSAATAAVAAIRSNPEAVSVSQPTGTTLLQLQQLLQQQQAPAALQALLSLQQAIQTAAPVALQQQPPPPPPQDQQQQQQTLQRPAVQQQQQQVPRAQPFLQNQLQQSPATLQQQHIVGALQGQQVQQQQHPSAPAAGDARVAYGGGVPPEPQQQPPQQQLQQQQQQQQQQPEQHQQPQAHGRIKTSVRILVIRCSVVPA